MQKGDRVFVPRMCDNDTILDITEGPHAVYHIKLDLGGKVATYDCDLRLLTPPKSPEEMPLEVTVKKTLSSCEVGDAVLTDHGKGTVIASDYDQNGNYCKVLLESGEVIYTTDIYEKISPKIYPLDVTGRTISRGDLVQCVNSNVQGRVTNISYINNTWYCSFVHDNGIATALAACPSQDLRIVEESPEEKGPEQMFPEQKNPEEKSPAPKLKVGDRVYTLGYGLGTIRRYDKHSNTYDFEDSFGNVWGEFREEEELAGAGTCTTPKEQKETPQKETPPPKKKFEVGDKVRVTPFTREPFDATVTDAELDCHGDWIYTVLPNSDNAIFEAHHHEWWKEKNLEKKEMSCCKENPAQIPEQIPATEISLQDAYERIRRELERNPLYYNAWKDKLTQQIEGYLGAEFADDDSYKILAGLFKLAKPTATFDSFH